MNRKEFEQKLAEQAAADPAFKARLIADPAAVLSEELAKVTPGGAIPAGLTITVLEETPAQIYIVLPATAAAGALSDAQLQSVAGGQGEATQPATTSIVMANFINESAVVTNSGLVVVA